LIQGRPKVCSRLQEERARNPAQNPKKKRLKSKRPFRDEGTFKGNQKPRYRHLPELSRERKPKVNPRTAYKRFRILRLTTRKRSEKEGEAGCKTNQKGATI